jgi:hypothetical protein
MNRLLLSLTTFLLIALPHAATAQDGDTSSGWPVVERCVTPTVRSDGWTFDGTILLEGYAGIHGVNAAWPTPRVLVFLRDAVMAGDAGLSPDGKWYAKLHQEIFYGKNYNDLFAIDGIRVYSTEDRNEVYFFSWDNYYFRNEGGDRMYWLDNSHLIYKYIRRASGERVRTLVIDPFDGSTIEWKGVKRYRVLYIRAIYPWEWPTQYPSPDFTRVLIYWFWGGEPPGLYYPASYGLITEINLAHEPSVKWMQDSSRFVAEIDTDPDEQRESRQLALFNREGNQLDVLIALGDDDSLSIPAAGWSSDGRYLAVTIKHQENRVLHLVDLDNHQIINTCLPIGDGAAFSPDNTQLALLEPGTGTRYVMVLDLETWTLHPVARHIVEDGDGSVIGWREDQPRPAWIYPTPRPLPQPSWRGGDWRRASPLSAWGEGI